MLRSEKRMGVKSELVEQALSHVGSALLFDSSPRSGTVKGVNLRGRLSNLFFLCPLHSKSRSCLTPGRIAKRRLGFFTKRLTSISNLDILTIEARYIEMR